MYDIQPVPEKIGRSDAGAKKPVGRSGRGLQADEGHRRLTDQNKPGSIDLNATAQLHFPFLQGVKKEEREMIHSRMYYQKYHKKDYIYLPYNTGEMVYFIINGNVEIGYLDESGRELSLDILGAGEVFGSFMGKKLSHSESMTGSFARSVDRAVLAVLNKNDFEVFLEKFPRFSYRILKMMSHRINTLETKLQNLVFSDVKTRICKLLFSLYEKAGDKRNGQIKIPLTHQDIANLVASSRETASLHLSELKKSGTIAYQRKRIRILSMNELQRCTASCS